MSQPVRYQVFVSSTYEDLREERQQATQAILQSGGFPSGMELFPASDDSQWDLIKSVIEESDYYIVILGGRYGSLGPDGRSYTEMEYDYAIEKGIPVLGFVRDNVGDIASGKSETTDVGREKLRLFREKVMQKHCRKYLSADGLGMAVLQSLMTETRLRPRTGWVPASQARSNEDIQRERRQSDEIENLRRSVEKLSRELKDRIVTKEAVPRSKIAQDEDELCIEFTYNGTDKQKCLESILITWNEIFRVIAPSMFGYVIRKDHHKKYAFHDDFESYISKKAFGKTQGRRVYIEGSDVDSFIFQFKELGFVMFTDIPEEDGQNFRGITLTDAGEVKLSLLSLKLKS